MSLNHYVKMHENGNTFLPSEPMTVYLYPWSSNQDSAVQSDGIATTSIKDVADQLLNYGAVDYYAIYRWDSDHSDTNYPKWGDIDDCSYDEIKENFRSFVKNNGDTSYCGTVPKNGTGEDHYTHAGVHQLIHGGSTGCNETAGVPAPAGAGGESTGQTSFNEGRVTWSPICSDNALTEAAAVQETVHMFIDSDYDLTNQCQEENDGDPTTWVNEHSLGTITEKESLKYYECSPMLTYHWDGDDYESPDCVCPRDLDTTPDSHTTTLTNCTKESVKETADNV